MKLPICNSNANTNDEYKKIIKFRMKIMVILFILGVTTLTLVLYANTVNPYTKQYISGVYSGIGTGFTCISIILWIKNKLLLNNEEKLKISRINNTDERIRAISSKAFKTGTIGLLISIYATALIGGLFYPILIIILIINVSVFLVIYVISYKLYERKM